MCQVINDSMENVQVPCKILRVDDDDDLPVCLTLNAWQFWNEKSSLAKGTNLLDDGSEFICDRRCGPSDYHAEWRRYDSEDYRLLIAHHEFPVSPNEILTIKRLGSIGQVMAYCATNLHPSETSE